MMNLIKEKKRGGKFSNGLQAAVFAHGTGETPVRMDSAILTLSLHSQIESKTIQPTDIFMDNMKPKHRYFNATNG